MSPYVIRAARRTLPPASYDGFRPAEWAVPTRQWNVAELQAWDAAERATATRDDDPSDATWRAMRRGRIAR